MIARTAIGTPGDQHSKAAGAMARTWPALPVTVFLVSLVTPLVLSVGSLAVSSYRLVLLALAVPCLISWMSGKAGPIRAVDILLGLFCLWCAIAITVVHGPEAAIEPAGMLTIETFIAYLMARCYVRSREDMIAVARVLFILIAVLFPLAIWETVTGQKATLQLVRMVMPTIADSYTDPRWGLSRVQGPFEHPILFGVFCGAAAALTYLVLGQQLGRSQRYAATAIVAMTSMLSLSSGPLLALVAQLALLAWNGLLGPIAARWRILWVAGALVYAVVELITDQSVAQIVTRYAFDPWTAFYRLLIFEHGWASIMAHPLFGTGFNEWVRPSWMSASIDMFWLVPGVRHGLPAAILILLAFFTAAASVGFKSYQDQRLVMCRTAYLITLTGFFLAGWAVHFWMATYVLFMFLLGSGMWLLDADNTAIATNDRPARPTLRRSGMVPVAARFSRRAS